MENAIGSPARRRAGPVRGLGVLVVEVVVGIGRIGVGGAERQSLKLGKAACLESIQPKRCAVAVGVIESVTRINDHAITAQRDLDRTVLSTAGDMVQSDLCCADPERIEPQDVQPCQARAAASVTEYCDRSCPYDMKQ